jgi:hypothetical protein
VVAPVRPPSLAEAGEERRSERTSLVCLPVADGRARCGFCGRRRADSGGMAEAPARPKSGKLRGRRPGVRICAACVELCWEIVAEGVSRA